MFRCRLRHRQNDGDHSICGIRTRSAFKFRHFHRLDRAPHPNATKLFVNWFLSKEGQTAVHTLADGNPPPSWREDLTRFDTVVPEERREPGKKYELLAAPQFIAKTPEATEWQTRMRSQLIESR